MAYGIHCSLGGNPPMSHRIDVLNSFVLPAHEVDVSYAPLRGQCPNGLIQPDLSLARFVNVQNHQLLVKPV